MSTSTRDTESLSMSALSVVLIGPDEQRRRAVAKALAGPQAKIARVVSAIRKWAISPRSSKPIMTSSDRGPRSGSGAGSGCGRNPLRQDNSVTVMVYSARGDSEFRWCAACAPGRANS